MNIPKLRFKGFDDEWKLIDLSKTFTYFSTNSLSREQLSNDGKVKNIHYGDIHRKFSTIVNVKKDVDTFIKDLNYNNKYELCKDYDLILADASEDYDGIGKAIEIMNVTDDTVSGLHTILARDVKGIFAPKFKGYYFNSPIIHNQMRILANGFKVYGISKDTINKLNAKIPSFKEQEKISNTLNLLDKKIELQSRKIEDLKLFKKGLLYKLFNAIDGNNYLLLEVADFENGKGHENIIDDTGNYILINSKFISTDGNVIKKCSEQLTPLFKNDITMVMSDLPNGKALAKCYYIEEDNKYSLNQRICKIHIKDNKIINSKYLFYLLNRNPYFLKFDDGVNQTNLKKDDILNINLNIPSIDIQNKKSKIITSLDNLINKESVKLSKLESLKKGLMQNMFV